MHSSELLTVDLTLQIGNKDEVSKEKEWILYVKYKVSRYEVFNNNISLISL